jgi:hypothetical protein
MDGARNAGPIWRARPSPKVWGAAILRIIRSQIMSVFHFKGELLERKADSARYRFQTDYIGDAERVGIFSVNLRSWDGSIDESADSRCYADGTSRDVHCVAALVYKIRKAYTRDGLPEVVFHIA